MKHLLLVTLVLLSGISQAHEIRLSTQHLSINKQDEEGWQHGIVGTAKLSRRWEVGLSGTYVERFDLFENMIGGLAVYRPKEGMTLEGGYLQGPSENQLLPRNQKNLNGFFALVPGISTYLLYRDARYSVTRLHAINLGLEIEKWPGLIIIPNVMSGRATFQSPAETKDIHNYGVKLIHYVEGSYTIFTFLNKGIEASQAILGRGSQLVDTLTGGVGASYFFSPEMRGELIIDHTDYDQLNNQFITTTINLTWGF